MCLLPKRALHRDDRRNFCVVDFRFLLLFSRPPPPLLCLHLFTFACFFFQESRFTPLIPQLRKRDVTTQPLKRRARFQEIGMLSDQEVCVCFVITSF